MPRRPTLYALEDNKGNVAYVGISEKLQQRLISDRDYAICQTGLFKPLSPVAQLFARKF